jgi:M6 family metalloprotease-like protein
MNNTSKKYCLAVLGINAAFFLGGCGSGEAANSALLTATKGTSGYSFPIRSADKSGTNYASKTSTLTERQLSQAGVGPVFPSTGSPKLLIIPVELSDYSSVCTEATRASIYKAFFGNSSGETAWESVASYYAKSSYGNLIINGTVSEWYDCNLSTSQLLAMGKAHAQEVNYDPTWEILEGAVAWYEKKYNTNAASFDSDGDGLIDGVWLVYSAPYYNAAKKNYKSEDYANYLWAYTYHDYSASTRARTGSNRLAYNYSWASYDFMYSAYGATTVDAHTFIHETGHLMGLEDYYTYEQSVLENTANYSPMGKVDMMDYNIIDHNAYSKFALGWVHPYVVSGATSLTLHPSASTGECVLLPTGKGWNGSAFDEYLLLEYYTPTFLNQKDSLEPYPGNDLQGFSSNGVRIYHVDSRMATFTGVANEQSKTVTYEYRYSDTLVGLSSDSMKGTLLAHSNTNGLNYLDSDYRLIQELDATEGRNFDVDTELVEGEEVGCTATDASLFHDGDTFSYAAYAHSFPQFYYSGGINQLMNDGSKMPYSVTFSESSVEGITLSINLA